jgi:hypothetical protein
MFNFSYGLACLLYDGNVVMNWKGFVRELSYPKRGAMLTYL